MEFKIEGEALWQVTKGFGPFKRMVIEKEPFSCTVSAGMPRVSPIDDMSFGCVKTQRGYVIDGSLCGVECIFDEFSPRDDRQQSNFVMVSVSGVQVRGRIEAIAAPLRAVVGGYAA